MSAEERVAVECLLRAKAELISMYEKYLDTSFLNEVPEFNQAKGQIEGCRQVLSDIIKLNDK